MKGYLLDTCAISEFTKLAPNLGLVEWLARIDPSIVYLSAITLGELRYGIALQRDARRRSALENWLRAEVLVQFEGRILAFDALAADVWGRSRARSRAAAVIDAQIAATGQQHGLAVVTRNDADFRRLGADVLNPWR